jgi:peptidoglycan/LPS O-acetylase OafA/YrhL
VVLCVACVLGWFIFLGNEFRQLGKYVAAGATFLSNVALLDDSGYFNLIGENMPLLHLWSLAVEEQFYIVWPVLFWLLWKRDIILFLAVAGLSCLSFGLSLGPIARGSHAAFYLSQARAWEFGIGGLLALFHYSCRPVLRTHHGIILGAAGLLGLGLTFRFLNEIQPYPGIRALTPTVSAMLLIASGSGSWINRVMLSNPLLVACGRISYPLYLWHWMLFSFARVVRGEVPSGRTRLMLLLLSGLLASLTYWLVEKPLRFGPRTALKTGILVSVAAGLGCVGLLIEYGRLPSQSDRRPEYANLAKRVEFSQHDFDYPGSLQPFLFHGATLYRKQGRVDNLEVWFLGDSHVQQYAPRIVRLLAEHPERYRTAVFSTYGGCAPVRSLRPVDQPARCDGVVEKELEYGMSPEISTVVVGAAWNYYFLSSGAYYVDRSGRAGFDRVYQELETTLAGFTRAGKRVFLLLDIPASPEVDPLRSFSRRFSLRAFAFEYVLGSGESRQALVDEYGGSVLRLRAIAQNAGAQVIDPYEFLCSADKCPAVQPNGDPIYKDSDHLSASFVRDHAGFIDRVLEPWH